MMLAYSSLFLKRLNNSQHRLISDVKHLTPTVPQNFELIYARTISMLVLFNDSQMR